MIPHNFTRRPYTSDQCDTCGMRQSECKGTGAGVSATPGEPLETPAPLTATGILDAAAQHMRDRASQRDQEGGERSMARIVATFNALTGHNLTERDGWAFMVALKLGRAYCTPTGTPDDYQDGAAYFGLMGECASK